MKAILAFDQGTTSSRAIAFGRDGRILGTAPQEFRQIFPQPGWVEHDPGEIWSSQLRAARDALARAGVAAAQVAAIGITNQRETAVVWDRTTGEPIHRAIVWQSRQTVPLCDALRQGQFFVTTGEVLVRDFNVGGKSSGETLALASGERTSTDFSELRSMNS